MSQQDAQRSLEIDGNAKNYFSLVALGQELGRLPFSLRVLLENLLRHDHHEDAQAILKWEPKATPRKEISFTPSRVLLQDFTGVPCVVDLASMRDCMERLGGDPTRINPLRPVELVIDHSVQVDAYGSDAAMQINLDREYERNTERYQFLKWGKEAFENFKVVPPNTGICHQVNLEYLSRVVFDENETLFFDTLVGTDSHTTMVNGLGVLGWGVGGIEAEAAMLGQPVSMLLPQVVGVRITGQLREGSTATDLVLTLTEMLRNHGVVGKFVEFFGPGIEHLPLADRATLGNMSPEFGSTCAISPIDRVTLEYLRTSGRSEEHIQRVEQYCRAQGTYHTADSQEPEYSSVVELELGEVIPSIAGPKRPQDRHSLENARSSFFDQFPDAKPSKNGSVTNGSVVIAAITSCTNTSNPSVMVAAGLVARKAAARGLKPKPWVKTSLAPGSRVVTEYLEESGLMDDLEAVGFDLVGYGCTTCIGNSGPLPEEVAQQVTAEDLAVVGVLSGNRNFEGRIQQQVKANYLMSPPLVVAYSFAGTIDTDIQKEPLGQDQSGSDVYLRDVWPTRQEVAEIVEKHVRREMFVESYSTLYKGDDRWNELQIPTGDRYDWQENSTYIREAPFFEGMTPQPTDIGPMTDLVCLVKVGDSVTTDHISPAGAIKLQSPAGEYLTGHGVGPHLFNSYGSRRGNHEVMMRGTFANVRLRNELAPGTEGGFTTHFPTGDVTTIFEAAMRYREAGTELIVLAGEEYGAGSSRDWAAKGTLLLGVRAVLAKSFERIHRSNLIGMGVLPLEFAGKAPTLTGKERFSILGLPEALANRFANGKELDVIADDHRFKAKVRIDTPMECAYYLNGGILQYVMRNLLKG